MISKFFDMVTASVDWWHGFLGAMCAPVPILTMFGVTSVIALFFTLRYEYKKWGHMWGGEGLLEIIFSGFFGMCFTAFFYMMPFVFWMGIIGVIVLGFSIVLEVLVKISVRGR